MAPDGTRREHSEAGDQRRTRRMQSADAISVDTDDSGTAMLHLPTGVNSSSWEPTLAPIEVIDGQHRLWAFEDNDYADEFDLPVVAFHGLDISWQAYLFWTINIKPKKINSSLAFDLYPLLRTYRHIDFSDSTRFVAVDVWGSVVTS
jgi:hypothetical protein